VECWDRESLVGAQKEAALQTWLRWLRRCTVLLGLLGAVACNGAGESSEPTKDAVSADSPAADAPTGDSLGGDGFNHDATTGDAGSDDAFAVDIVDAADVASAPDCDDDNPCTEDLAGDDGCSHKPVVGPCDDGNACTTSSLCVAGTCLPPDEATVTTVAGNGLEATVDGPADKASFQGPFDIAPGPDGAIFVADRKAHRIRRIGADGVVSTFSGSGSKGASDGPAAKAELHQINSLAARKGGGFVALTDIGSRIRAIDMTGTTSTLAGGGMGTEVGGGPAKVFNARDLAEASDGGIVWVEYATSQLRRLDPATGKVVTLAGSTHGFADGPAAKALFKHPHGVDAAPDGTIYVGDYGNHRIRALGTDGVVITVAGSHPGSEDGPLGLGRMNLPRRIEWSAGHIFFIETGTRRLRVVQPDGSLKSLAGGKVAGNADGPGSLASFNWLYGLAVLDNSHIWLADFEARNIRRVTLPKKLCPTGQTCKEGVCAAP